MMGFRTPFYDINRKLMFHGIINLPPSFPPHFTTTAKAVLLRLLDKDPSQRLGSKGAHEIKMTDFFGSLDFQKLLMCYLMKLGISPKTFLKFRREITPPFHPKVSNEEDTKYVPTAYLSASPEDSIDKTAKEEETQHFQGFTFNPSLRQI